MEKLIFEKSQRDEKVSAAGAGCPLDRPRDGPAQGLPSDASGGASGDERVRRRPPLYPSLSAELQHRHGISIPRSCTMKYNPKVNEQIANFTGSNCFIPFSRPRPSRGSFKSITSWSAFFRRCAGWRNSRCSRRRRARRAHRAPHRPRLSQVQRKPAQDRHPPRFRPWHEPASAMIAATMSSRSIRRARRVDLASLKAALNQDTAVFMLTNPSTLDSSKSM